MQVYEEGRDGEHLRPRILAMDPQNGRKAVEVNA
jgi:hypothetical protein